MPNHCDICQNTGRGIRKGIYKTPSIIPNLLVNETPIPIHNSLKCNFITFRTLSFFHVEREYSLH